MQYTKRYIPTKCLQIKNELIPFWELNFTKHRDYGEGYYTKDSNEWHAHYQELIDCYWDSKQHKIISGLVKDIYPKEDQYNKLYKKGDEVLVEKDTNSFYLDKIKEVVYEEYDSHIYKVKKMDNWYRQFFTEEELADPNTLYEIRVWKPFYKLESGKLIRYDYQLKTLVNK